MSPIITNLVVAFLGLYAVIIIIELIVSRSLHRFMLELVIMVAVVVVLNVTTGFPTPRRAFGGVSPVTAVAVMFVCTMLGIAARYFFYVQDFSWRSLIKPLVISPIVLLPLIGSVQGITSIESIQLISFGILAFQNGFFWKVVLERTKGQLDDDSE